MDPLLILVVGMVAVVVLIVVCRVHAFLALIISAGIVSLLAPGSPGETISRVANEFGAAVGRIGIVIALAAVIGTCMMESGAADRIVQGFLRLLGERRASVALTCSGYVLAIPVFFDTVFYLLVPLARSLFRQTGRNYLLFIMAVAAGGAITHTLVPPTPGPLVIASQLQVDLGVMIVMGAAVAFPASAAGLLFAAWLNRRMPIPLREVPGLSERAAPSGRLPPLGLSLLPIVLPVVLISARTMAEVLFRAADNPAAAAWQEWIQLLGDPNLALFVAMLFAVGIYRRQTGASRSQTLQMVETSLLSAGVIILITAAGGAFGAMLKTARVGEAIERTFAPAVSPPPAGPSAGDPQGASDGPPSAGEAAVARAEPPLRPNLTYLFLGFGVAAILKIAQGSSTVAMITAASMLAAILPSPQALGCHPVYLALSIGAGSLIGSWMNDSGFWIFAKMGGLTEAETLQSWTPLLMVLGGVSFVVTLLLAMLWPGLTL